MTSQKSLLLILPIFMLLSCDESSDTIDLTDFRQDLVTCLHDADRLIFKRDDGMYLYPEEALPATSFPEEQRVVIGYSPDETVGNHTEIELVTSIGEIPYTTISQVSLIEAALLPDDPLYLTTIWYGGGCINLRYKIEFHDKAHSMAMISIDDKATADTLDVELRYNTHDDAPGYYRSGYASFRPEKPLPPTIRVTINTANLDGKREFIFNTK